MRYSTAMTASFACTLGLVAILGYQVSSTSPLTSSAKSARTVGVKNPLLRGMGYQQVTPGLRKVGQDISLRPRSLGMRGGEFKVRSGSQPTEISANDPGLCFAFP